jgi:UDP-N-acetylglucosamine diphosphorylase / glucose-1-phosphate thymidylyltransferase / UDP-N-acetylgalactosamine diphosphorylase / glucosamine-1-phosphate N-acetyltransferase / galactosamine-1-phosphate N-acetyltransferase
LVDPKEAEPRTLRIPIDNWIELGALLLLGRNPNSACLLDSEGNILAWKGSADPECEEKIVTDANCFPVIYPWDLLRMNEEVLALMDETSLLGEVSPLASLSGMVRSATARASCPAP